jgi:hypothetical protein
VATGDRVFDGVYVAEAACAVGKLEEAICALESAVTAGAPELVSIGVDPALDPLRRLRRFHALTTKIGLLLPTATS